jgi:hypothetical protein
VIPRPPTAARRLAGALALLLSAGASAQEWLDRVDDALFLQSRDGVWRADLSGTLDLEGYSIDQEPPGLIFSDGDDALFNPRLSLFLDLRAGKHFYAFLQARFDRGFDPGLDQDGDVRADEYFLRYAPFADARLNVQAGKFATVFGNYVARHHSWDNPFINAPLPYEHVLTIPDQTVPASPAAFLARRNLPDNKTAWLPTLWGPSYTTGGAAFGALGGLDYAVEFKNASVSSRPAAWSAWDVNFSAPTIGGRLGWRPGPAWTFGASASGGSYLLPAAESAPAFPAGKDRSSFDQLTVGADAGWAWRRLQLWAEVFLSRFEVPNVGDADTVAYYLEAKLKLDSRFFVAARWNQQFFGKVPDGAGGEARWDNDAWRLDGALGCRLTRHLQAKLQYSYSHQLGNQQQGEQLVAAQATVKF